MDFLDLFGLLLLAAIAWLWLDSLKAREMAVAATKAACNAEHLLLLDDTVAIQRLSLGRDGEGLLLFLFVYFLVYSDTGNERTAGSIVMLGSRVIVINLNLRDTPENLVIRGPWN